MNAEINPFDILSGKVAKNEYGTYWFKKPGNNMHKDGWPILENLFREDGPAVEYYNGPNIWYYEGVGYSEQDYKEMLISKQNVRRNKPI